MTTPANSILYMAAAAVFACVAAASDLKTRRIPNKLTATALMSAALLHLVGGGGRGLADSLAAAAIAGGAFVIPFFLGAMGGGDVKLMAAIAAFGGLGRLADLMIATALSGGALALVVALRHGYLRNILLRFAQSCAVMLRIPVVPPPVADSERRIFLPYGVAIAAGSLVTFCMGVMQP